MLFVAGAQAAGKAAKGEGRSRRRAAAARKEEHKGCRASQPGAEPAGKTKKRKGSMERAVKAKKERRSREEASKERQVWEKTEVALKCTATVLERENKELERLNAYSREVVRRPEHAVRRQAVVLKRDLGWVMRKLVAERGSEANDPIVCCDECVGHGRLQHEENE